MNYKTTFNEMYGLISEQLESGGSVRFSPNGTSMLPFIVQGRDEVVVKKACGRLKKYDIAFYRRENGSYILHRVVKFDKNKNYIFRGDHQFEYEYGITDSNIIGVVEKVYRRNKCINANSLTYKLWAIFGSLYFRTRNRLYKIKNKLENKNDN